MSYVFSPSELKAIARSPREPAGAPKRQAAARLIDEVANTDWASFEEIKDVCYLTDARGARRTLAQNESSHRSASAESGSTFVLIDRRRQRSGHSRALAEREPVLLPDVRFLGFASIADCSGADASHVRVGQK